jgi:hypothetical protein
MGPTCEFEDINVPCFVCFSEIGSITSHLLVVMLKRMDDFFPQDGSLMLPNPFLLLDGHGSRFDLTFLEYINHDDHKWTACIGIPSEKNKWQVGDSS